jgi:hypothetical protein
VAVRSRTYNTTNGAFSLIAPELAYRKIVSVKREGMGYNIVDTAPGNLQVQYLQMGEFVFNTAFIFQVEADPTSQTDILIQEKIFILWEE